MSTRLYLSRGGVAYTPPTVRGAWEQTAGHVVRGMHTLQDPANQGVQTSVSLSETSGSANFDVLCIRAISAPLAANCTFAGTLNLMLAVSENGSDADFAYYVHAYVTQGDSDTPRGTLLADYADPLTNEWPTLPGAGKALNAAQSLSSVAAQTGDRIVVEIGMRAYNTITGSRTGVIWHGGNGSDLTSGGSTTSGVGYIDFSDTFTLVNNPIMRVSQLAVETLYRPTTATLRVSQLAIETLYRPSTAKVRVSQLAVEVLRKNGTPSAPSSGGMLVIAT